jgi:hypothetical protein
MVAIPIARSNGHIHPTTIDYSIAVGSTSICKGQQVPASRGFCFKAPGQNPPEDSLAPASPSAHPAPALVITLGPGKMSRRQISVILAGFCDNYARDFIRQQHRQDLARFTEA